MKFKRERKEVLGIPLIEYKIGVNNPTIFFVHGIKRNKEYVESHVIKFVNKGFNVISIDAYMHGERKGSINDLELEMKYPYVVIETGNEINKLIDYYKKESLIGDKIFVMGISMGGAVALYTSMNLDINGYVSIIGSPSIVGFLEYCSNLLGVEFPKEEKDKLSSFDPLLNYDLLKGKNILLLNGVNDKRVPDKYSKELNKKIDSVDLKLYDTGHKVEDIMLEDIYEWLEAVL